MRMNDRIRFPLNKKLSSFTPQLRCTDSLCHCTVGTPAWQSRTLFVKKLLLQLDRVSSIDSMAARGRVKICIHAILIFDAFMHATLLPLIACAARALSANQAAPPLALGCAVLSITRPRSSACERQKRDDTWREPRLLTVGIARSDLPLPSPNTPPGRLSSPCPNPLQLR